MSGRSIHSIKLNRIINQKSHTTNNTKLNLKSLNKLFDIIITNICNELKLSSEIIDYQIIQYIKNLTSEFIKVTIKNVRAVEHKKIKGGTWVGSSGASYFIKLICFHIYISVFIYNLFKILTLFLYYQT